jgi:VWFA-related protein
MNNVRASLRKFISEQIQENDLVAIIRTGSDVGVLQQFTTDRRILNAAIDRIRWNPCSRVGVSLFPAANPMSMWPGGAPSAQSFGICGDLVASMDGLRSVIKGMRELPGRKSMVLLTDDFTTYSEAETYDTDPLKSSRVRRSPHLGNEGQDYSSMLERLSELAIRSSVVVYGFSTRGVTYAGPTAADDFSYVSSDDRSKFLEQRLNSDRHALDDADNLAKTTGGMLIRGTNDFYAGLRRVLDDQKGYFLIGYRPDGATFNRRSHKIKLRVKRPGLTVRTRSGFFGVTDELARETPTGSSDEMVTALTSPFAASALAIHATALFENDLMRGSYLRSFAYVEPDGLSFTEEPDSWQKLSIDLAAMLFGDNGQVLTRKSERATLHLRGKALEQVRQNGLVFRFNLPVPKSGTVQVRVAARDSESARIGSAGQVVVVPKLGGGQLLISGITLSGSPDPGGSVLNDESRISSSSVQQNEKLESKKDDQTLSGPGVRQFSVKSDINVEYVVFNARIDNVKKAPLTAQIKIFRDGKTVYKGEKLPLNFADRHDLKRLSVDTKLRLMSALDPGPYVLQILVYDELSNQKIRMATEWIDFEIVDR